MPRCDAGKGSAKSALPVLRSKVVLFHFHFHFLCFLHWCQHGLIVRAVQQAVGVVLPEEGTMRKKEGAAFPLREYGP